MGERKTRSDATPAYWMASRRVAGVVVKIKWAERAVAIKCTSEKVSLKMCGT